jgi:hypothetical protein
VTPDAAMVGEDRAGRPRFASLRVLIQAVTVPSRERVAVECELT